MESQARLIVVGVDASVSWLERLAGPLAASGCRVEWVAEAEAVAHAGTWHVTEAAPPAAVVLPDGLSQPWPLARTLHQAAPWAHLVFLTPADRVEELHDAARRLPLIGSHWSVVDPEADDFPTLLHAGLRAARRRLQFQAALARMNAQLGAASSGVGGRDPIITNHYLASVFEHAEDAILAVGLDDTVASWNRSAGRLFGLDQAGTVGLPVGVLVDPAHGGALAELVATARSGATVRNHEVLGRRGDGATFHGEVTLAPVFDGEGRIVAVSVIARDVTERKRHEAEVAALNEALAARVQDLRLSNLELEGALAQLEATKHELLELNAALERQATTDALTGLKNRIVFQNSLLEMMALAERQGTTMSLLLVDIDHFKRVNDRFGHQEGDRVLKAVAAALAAGVRDQDIVARFGGEEFAVLLPNTSLESAIPVAEHLRLACREAARLEPQLTVSIGVASFASGDSEVTLIGRADEALYASKAQGRNRVTAARARVAGGAQPA
jgi:diguanylate cyclase (GGDEF)-like protein/PAS domain S-box-containing protein